MARYLVLASLLVCALAGRHDGTQQQADLRIHSLPDFGAPPSAHYSGFVEGDEETNSNLFFWFAESENVPVSDPVMLWLNGGPGCSSLSGLLQEHGPLIMNKTGGIMRNPFSWNKNANVIYLESPAGVGFSYCGEKASACDFNNDILTAKMNRQALVNFFKIFPAFQGHDFYISGESYAGVYVPTLAEEILKNQDDFHINLKGIAVGDPCTDNESQGFIMDPVEYAYENKFITKELHSVLVDKCTTEISPAGSRMDEYNVTLRKTPECRHAWREFDLVTSQGFSQDPSSPFYINDYFQFGDAGQILLDWDEATMNYLNRDDVKKALHADCSPNSMWEGVCIMDPKWDYTNSYQACNDNPTPGTDSMINFYQRLTKKIRVLVFNADSDPCVPMLGTRKAIQRVGHNIQEGGQWRPWFYHATATDPKFIEAKSALFGPTLSDVDAGVQLGGYIESYENNLSFLTIHGSGHMVPEFKPISAAHFLNKFIAGEDISPLLPNDKTMETEDPDTFYDKTFPEWVKKAQGKDYVGENVVEGLRHNHPEAHMRARWNRFSGIRKMTPPTNKPL